MGQGVLKFQDPLGVHVVHKVILGFADPCLPRKPDPAPVQGVPPSSSVESRLGAIEADLFAPPEASAILLPQTVN
jgi:hypothetical protein